jgi:hypothetical protein
MLNPGDAHLFRQFTDQVVTDDANDPVRKEIQKIANDNGLTVRFNKVGAGMGGACVMPPPNQVNVALVEGRDKKWRVFNIG